MATAASTISNSIVSAIEMNTNGSPLQWKRRMLAIQCVRRVLHSFSDATVVALGCLDSYDWQTVLFTGDSIWGDSADRVAYEALEAYEG